MGLLSTLPQQKNLAEADDKTKKIHKQAYWMALQDLSDDVFIESVGRCLRGSTFFPTPSEIRRHAEDILAVCGVLPAEPSSAWEVVLRMARRWSPYGDNPKFDDEAVKRAVNELGGIGRIAMAHDSELPFIRKDFIARYEVYRRRQIDSDPELMGTALPERSHLRLVAGREAS